MVETAIYDMRRSEIRFLAPLGSGKAQEIKSVSSQEEAKWLLSSRGFAFSGGDLLERNKVYTRRVS
jgi:hypothetical protein